MKRLGIAVGVVLMLAAMPAWGAIVNPGFESGLTGWTVSNGGGNGSVTAVAVNSVWTAPQGSKFALLLTDTGTNSNNLTTLRQNVTLAAGEKVQFKYWFWDDSGTFVAKASVNLVGAPTINVLDLVDGVNNTPSGTWKTATSTAVSAAGTYAVTVAIQDGGSSVKRAGMGVDAFAILAGGTPPPPPPGPSGHMPEPMTMVAGFMGLAGLAGYIRRRRMA